MDIKRSAIVLSCHTIGLAVIRALGSVGIKVFAFYYEKKDMGYTSKFVKERVYTPHPEKNEAAFMEILLAYRKRLKGSILFPVDDPTLTTVSKNKGVLEEHYIVACPDWSIVKKYIDKKYTYALADELEIDSPLTVVPKRLDEVIEYANNVNFPCIVKPCKSHLYYEKFKTKMVKVYNKDDLIAEYHKAENAGTEVLLQEFIPGDDSQGINYNSYFCDGKPLVEFTAWKRRLAPPEIGLPRVVKSSYIPEVIEPGRKIIQALGFNGFSCTEFKKDSRDGTYKLMEVNGRHNRSGLLALKCGINFPLIEYRFLAEGYVPTHYHFTKDIYWVDEFLDVSNSLIHYKNERLSLKEFFRPYIRPHICAIFDMNDPKPFAKRIYDMFQMAFKKLTSFL